MAVAMKSVNEQPIDSVAAAAQRRLLALSAERERLTRRLSLIDELEKELRALFQSQQILIDAHVSSVVADLESHVSNYAIRSFIVEELKRTSPQTKSQLMGALIKRKFDLGGRSVARVMHMNLLTLMNSGEIEHDGLRWSIKRTNDMAR